jgi:3-deoxy-D-manno-octulosonic-acid transferase
VHRLIVRLFYNFALLLLLILGSPWWLLRLVTSDRFREGLGERFFGPSAASVVGLPGIRRIWIHAVSVGEVLAISGLVRELQSRALDYGIVVSTTTRTGQKLARERFGAEHCFYFPLDFPWSVRAAFDRVRPSVLVLAESELWPNVLSHCAGKNIPVAIVNARVSDRSLPRYRKLGILWRPFLKLLTVVQAQTAEDARRLAAIGVPEERVTVGGNLKFDVRAPLDAPIVESFRGILSGPARLLVCGSTLEGEEALLIAAWPKIVAAVPDAVMLLAPRHPERFDRVAALLQASGLPWTRRSAWIASLTPLPAGSIFLLDSIGELASLYALAAVAFVGGSLVEAGGHNPLEPAQFGVPIAMGPHYENFRDIVQLLIDQDAIRIVHPQTLDGELTALLRDAATAIGENAQRVFDAQSGATKRAADAILKVLGAAV